MDNRLLNNNIKYNYYAYATHTSSVNVAILVLPRAFSPFFNQNLGVATTTY